MDDATDRHEPVIAEEALKDENPHQVAEGVGGITGVAAGASLGILLLGPVGALIGAAAGALGGWWAGSAVSKAAGDFADEDDQHYRRLHEGAVPPEDRPYDQVRDLYVFGHLAGTNPDYHSGAFEDIEPDLRRVWEHSSGREHGEWPAVREYVERGYKGRQR